MQSAPCTHKLYCSANLNEARCLIVGGYAVAYHGYPRFTGDIDIFLEMSEENAGEIEAAFDALT